MSDLLKAAKPEPARLPPIKGASQYLDVIKELLAKGYQRPADIQYLEVLGGTHDPGTWGKAMPKFLQWAFGK